MLRAISRAVLLYGVVVFGLGGFPTLHATTPSAHPDPVAPQPLGLLDTVQRIKYNTKLPKLVVAIPGAPVGKKRNSLGRIRILVIPVRTSNIGENPMSQAQLTQTFFGNLLQETGGDRASVADYFRAASYGAVKQVTGKVLDWIVLDQPASHYFTGASILPQREFLEQAFTKADATVNYAEFDDDKVDGDTGAARNDGFVDIVIVVFDCGLGNYNACRWKMTLMDGADAQPWTSEDDEVLGVPGVEITQQVKVKIDDFIIIPWNLMADGRIGVACHEITHFLGLPDLYNRDNAMVGGIGQWCLMCLGCKEIVPDGDGYTLGASALFPPPLSAWCRAQLGWGREVKPDADGLLNLRPRQETGDYTIVKPPDTAPGNPAPESYYIEYYTPPDQRNPWGKAMLPDAASGFLVWHVDTQVGRDLQSPSFIWPSADQEHGQNDAPFAWPIQPLHPLIRLVQADGKLGLEAGHEDNKSPYNDAADLFTGSSLRFDQGEAGFTWYGSQPPQQVTFDPSGANIIVGTTGGHLAGAMAAPAASGIPSAPAAPTPAVHIPHTSPPAAPSSAATSVFLNQLKLDTVPPAQKRVLVDRADRDLTTLGTAISQNGGAGSKFARDLEKVVTLAGQTGPLDPAASKDLSTTSYRAMENAVNILKTDAATTITQKWERSRARKALSNDVTGAFLGKYSDPAAANPDAETVLSPDGKSVVKLGAQDLSLKPLDDNPVVDTKKRIWDLRALTGITLPEVKLEVDHDRPKSGNDDHRKVYLKFVANIGGTEIALNTQENWGEVSYSNDKQLQNVEFNRPTSVVGLPQTIDPKISGDEAVEQVRQSLGDQAPNASKVAWRMELILDPDNKTLGKWIPSYRVDLPLPSGQHATLFLDVNTGNRLE